MKTPVIIERLGLIYGRDAIFMDDYSGMETTSLRISGEFNGALCSNINRDVWIPFTIVFGGVSKIEISDIEEYDHLEYESSFEIKNTHSDGSITYVFHTYDDIFEVTATGYSLELKEERV